MRGRPVALGRLAWHPRSSSMGEAGCSPRGGGWSLVRWGCVRSVREGWLRARLVLLSRTPRNPQVLRGPTGRRVVTSGGRALPSPACGSPPVVGARGATWGGSGWPGGVTWGLGPAWVGEGLPGNQKVAGNPAQEKIRLPVGRWPGLGPAGPGRYGEGGETNEGEDKPGERWRGKGCVEHSPRGLASYGKTQQKHFPLNPD